MEIVDFSVDMPMKNGDLSNVFLHVFVVCLPEGLTTESRGQMMPDARSPCGRSRCGKSSWLSMRRCRGDDICGHLGKGEVNIVVNYDMIIHIYIYIVIPKNFEKMEKEFPSKFNGDLLFHPFGDDYQYIYIYIVYIPQII